MITINNHPMKNHYYKVLNPFTNTYTIIQYKKQTKYRTDIVHHLYSVDTKEKYTYRTRDISLRDISTIFSSETHLGTNYRAIKTMYLSNRSETKLVHLKSIFNSPRVYTGHSANFTIHTKDSMSYALKDIETTINSMSQHGIVTQLGDMFIVDQSSHNETSED